MKKIFVSCIMIMFLATISFAIFCPQCGTKNDDTAKFCTNCGTNLKGAEKKEEPKKEVDLSGIVKEVTPFVVGVRTLKNELNAQFKDVGSGFVIDKQGYIMTNTHLFGDQEDIEAIKVVLSDKKEYDAKIILCDYATDLAVLKIQAENLAPVKFGDSDKIISGEKIFAIGNPMGMEKSTSSGIVSAKDRCLSCYEYEGLIQIDAAINPGNSGGPLFNMNGEVIGITSLGFRYTEGMNFAIPASSASYIMTCISSGKVKRSWLGIAVTDITPTWKQWEETVNNRKIAESEGAIVVSIGEGKNLPFKKGDVIVSLNDVPIKKVWNLQREVLKTKVGDNVNITIKRDGKEQNFKIKASEKPREVKFPIEDEMNIVFGATLVAPSSGAGLKIEQIRTGSLAGMFKEGYVISKIYVNKKEGGVPIDITDINSFYEAFRKAYNYEKKHLEWEIFYTDQEGKKWRTNWRKDLVAITST